MTKNKKRTVKKKPQDNKLQRNAEQQHALAQDLHDHGKYDKAHKAYDKALSVFRKLAVKPSEHIQFELAQILFNKAALCCEQGMYEQSLAVNQECVSVFSALSERKPQQYLPIQASSMCNLASIQLEMGFNQEALSVLEAARAIQQEFAEADPTQNLPDFESILSNLAMAYEVTGSFTQAQSVYDELLLINKQLVATNPQYFLDRLGMTLNNYASLLISAGDYEKALSLCEEAQLSNCQLAREYDHYSIEHEALLLGNMGKALSALDRVEESCESLEACLAIFRRLAQDKPAQFEPELAQTLSLLASVEAQGQKYTSAMIHFEEVQQLYSQLSQHNMERFLPMYVKALTDMGTALFDMDEHEKARLFFERTIEEFNVLANTGNFAAQLFEMRVIGYYACQLHGIDCYDEAKNRFTQALDSCRQLVIDESGEMDADMAMLQHHFANLLFDMLAFDTARVHAGQSLKLFEQLAQEVPGMYDDIVEEATTLLADIDEQSAATD